MHHDSHRSASAILTYSCNFVFGIIGHTHLGWVFALSQSPWYWILHFINGNAFAIDV